MTVREEDESQNKNQTLLALLIDGVYQRQVVVDNRSSVSVHPSSPQACIQIF
jgi:D-arabinose 1-dehydrogenase-like Zn-dependent alcohol dehydrogenase